MVQPGTIGKMTAALALWFVVTIPVGIALGGWGWAVLRPERGLGRVLIVWAVVLPFLPPLLMLVTRAAFGDAGGGSDSHEPWPHWWAAGFFSFAGAVVITPLLVVIAAFWMLAGPSPDSRQAELIDDSQR